MGIQSYATMGGLRETVDIFIRNEVDERDQKRYRAFLDLDTLEERVAKEGFIQSFFRMKSSGDWKSIRISKIPSDTESLYLYTIQSLLKEENDRMNEYLLDHPDL